MNVDFEDLEFLTAVQDYTLEHPHPEVERFKASMRDWGNDWRAVEPVYHAAADWLDQAARQADSHELVARFALHKHRLRWEQSYRREDGLVPEAMLDGYAFAEILGKRGPFVSQRIRCGIGVWGPAIEYPRHHHQAEEIYILLAGSAEFDIGEAGPVRRGSGDVVYVAPNEVHGFETIEDLLVVFYLWQAGDLRQTSTFA